MKNRWVIAVMIAGLWVMPALGKESVPMTVGTEKAVELFEIIRKYKINGDENIADIYDDTAVIKIVGKNMNNDFEDKEMTGADYKLFHKLFQKLLATKPSGKPESTPANFRYTKEDYAIKGDRVVITATRYFWEEDYSLDEILTVGPDTSGVWKIFEEITYCCPPSTGGRRPQ